MGIIKATTGLEKEVKEFVRSTVSSFPHIVRDEIMGELLLYKYGHQDFPDWNCILQATAEVIESKSPDELETYWTYTKLAEGAMNYSNSSYSSGGEVVAAIKKCRSLGRLIYGLNREFNCVVTFKEAKSFLKLAKMGSHVAMGDIKTIPAEDILRISKTSAKKSNKAANLKQRAERVAIEG